MNVHESVRKLLPLLAAGALDPQDQLQVEAHLRVCEICSLELREWSIYGAGLRKLPQPIVPSDLIARTQARVLREHEAAASMRWNGITLFGLGMFSWIASVTLWWIVHELTSGRVVMLGTNLVSAGPWFLVSFAVASMTAAATALLIGNRGEIGRAL